ncbi:MAG: ester cyclase [Chloroflexi bacterium AL-W]|nr:ester cyclase [Chloroflexi bacterium AL-N1]NOK66843.1 ester cyclase [Chloroflexi bacterium AL-N10]NOK74865.1 ester cyclase [Chloroflexi bacterium AL-N5]NOK81446.1 ester cyclase [Chloroflexi bacterium AL-W]NOK88915.1 ester cyclase [Chloroflexi bacterium AL-N15]
MTPEENKQFMQHFVEQTINQKNLAIIDELVAEDFIEHIPFPGQGPGREGLKFAIGALLTAFPDMHWTIEEQVAEGETVISRFSWTGTHCGAFMGIPATEKSVESWGVVIDVIRDGKFSESRILMDSLGMLQQLGVLPAPGEGS